MKVLLTISRILVGSLFIVSGLIKANDSLGFSYKLVEYFEPGVLNMEFLIPFALPLAIIISVVEIILGFLVLFGAKIKLSSWVLLAMILFFSWLTFYSAYFNKVTDCGCFGDAIKLTPWQSFTKDIVLLVFVLIIFIKRKTVRINNTRQNQIILPIATLLIALFSILMLQWSWAIFFFVFTALSSLIIMHYVWTEKKDLAVILASTFFSAAVVFYTIRYLPLKDFRPYAIGKSIPEGMKSAEELGLKGPVYATDFLLKNKSTGEEKVFTSVQYSEDKLYTDWEYVESQGESYKLKDGYEPPIHDFSLQDELGYDQTAEILNQSKTVLLVCYDLEKSKVQAIADFEEAYKKLTMQGIGAYILTASVDEEIEACKAESKTSIPFLLADGITLKTIVRSNPGFVVLSKGKILDKWSYRKPKNAEEIIALF